MIGIALPWNFGRPYAALSVIDFWRRWHITLSAFLRDYLYIPLGGSRSGHYRNLMLTMLLGGLWHGAAWTFVAWGFLHGLYLVANHVFRQHSRFELPAGASWLLTTVAVTFAWIFFRAEGFAPALNLILSLSNFSHMTRPEMFLPFFNSLPFQADAWNSVSANTVVATAMVLLLASYLASIVWDTRSMMEGYPRLRARTRTLLMIACACAIFVGLHLQSSGGVKFIYFEF
jgi:D-alanyl-lipoteichoic acid acyltransferase DltB (MBOAT superfamily)